MHEKIALGTVQFGLKYGISNQDGKVQEHEVNAILDLCKISGISVIDTASAYGNAEQVLGRAGVNDFKIVSKFLPNTTNEAFNQQFEESCKHLNQNKLYAYLAHRPENLLEQPQEWEMLQSLKEAGRVQKIGYSLNKPQELEDLLNKGFIPDIVQIPYNFLDRRFEQFRDDFKNNGVEVHARSAFLQGLLLMNLENLPVFFKSIQPVLQRMREHINDLPGTLLRFVLEADFVNYVVIGVESKHQLNNNLSSLKMSTSFHMEIPEIADEILMPMYWPKQ